MSYSRYIKWGLWLVLFLLIVIAAVLYSLSRGEIDIPLSKIAAILLDGEGSIEYTVLREIRLPRIILGLSVGGALSLAGVILQGIYRNPLVEPYTLGISGGAALGVAFAIVSGLSYTIGSIMLPAAGFIGALATVVSVYILSVRKGKIHTQNMLLIGVMVSFIASSAMMFIMATTTNENLHNIVFWVMGSLDEANGNLIRIATIISLCGLVVTYLFIHTLNALRLGEEKARHLGINTDISIKLLFIIASLLTGMCVSVAGVIGFVGLIIPQFIRIVVGSDFRILIISSFLTGGGFIVFCDTLARTIIAPNELPIGVITGVIGGISFIFILINLGRKPRLM
ncbi:MAG: iron ABC transporter permease [Bacteroidales bacterium]|nr:iron ABC transporter permease [Bacteroidales bacterium]